MFVSLMMFWLGMVQVGSQMFLGDQFDLGILLLGVFGVIAAGSLLENPKKYRWIAQLTAVLGISRMMFLLMADPKVLLIWLELAVYVGFVWCCLSKRYFGFGATHESTAGVKF